MTFDSGSYALANGFALETEAGFQLSDFVGGTGSSVPSFFAPIGGSGNVARFVKSASETEVGASIVVLDSGEIVDEDVNQITARFYTQSNDGTIRLKLEDTLGGDAVELSAVTASDMVGQWQTISWDASAISDHSPNFDKAAIYVDAFDSAATETYYIDDVQFY